MEMETMKIKTNQMSRSENGRAEEAALRARNPRKSRTCLVHERKANSGLATLTTLNKRGSTKNPPQTRVKDPRPRLVDSAASWGPHENRAHNLLKTRRWSRSSVIFI